jgi:hypothetical protein
MISFVRGSALAFVVASFCLGLGVPAHAGCVGLSGTADGFDKENMFCLGIRCGIYKPDVVNASSYTVCWHGVVSPYVCTSGAKICW